MHSALCTLPATRTCQHDYTTTNGDKLPNADFLKNAQLVYRPIARPTVTGVVTHWAAVNI